MPDPLIGARVGNYRVVDVLGEGGMGIVYRAVHPELERTVAIKVLALGLSQSDDIVRRFRVEARSVNRIRHPNVVDVQDFGTLPDGRPYYIMEFLEGESLSGYLKRVGAVGAADALVILAPLTEALEAAHAAGVVHRDLKPDNIFLVARRNASPIPKLLDFGIAKVLSETVASGTARTHSGAVMGTPLYMSPEQAAGRVEAIGTASDVYSLGVILYEMVTGSVPFNAPGMGELLLMHMQEPPPPPSSRRPGIPQPLESLILRMLAKAPVDRPPDAAAVRREVVALTHALRVDATRALESPPSAPTLIAPAEALAQVATPPPPVSVPGKTSPSGFVGELGVRTATPAARRPVGLIAAAGVVAAIVVVAIVLLASRGGDETRSAAPPSPPPAIDAAAPLAIPIDAPPPPDAAPAPAAAVDAGSELERRLEALKNLHDDGLITDEEYERRRKVILQDL